MAGYHESVQGVVKMDTFDIIIPVSLGLIGILLTLVALFKEMDIGNFTFVVIMSMGCFFGAWLTFPRGGDKC